MLLGETCNECSEAKVRAEISHSRTEKWRIARGGGGLSLGDLINPNSFDSSELCANPYCEQGRKEIAARLREVNNGLELTGETGDWRALDTVELDRLRDLTARAATLVERDDVNSTNEKEIQTLWGEHITHRKKELISNCDEAREWEILNRNMPPVPPFRPFASRIGDVETIIENLESIDQQL